MPYHLKAAEGHYVAADPRMVSPFGWSTSPGVAFPNEAEARAALAAMGPHGQGVRVVVADTTIDLSRPVRSEKRRGFQPPWYTVYVYRCAAGHEVVVRANSYRGKRPVPSTGGIRCPQCTDVGHGRDWQGAPTP